MISKPNLAMEPTESKTGFFDVLNAGSKREHIILWILS